MQHIYQEEETPHGDSPIKSATVMIQQVNGEMEEEEEKEQPSPLEKKEHELKDIKLKKDYHQTAPGLENENEIEIPTEYGKI